MKIEMGSIVLNSEENEVWYKLYKEITSNPESTDEEINLVNSIMDKITYED